MEYKDMQVDHVYSVYRFNGEDDIENYMPSCRMCNYYKRTMTPNEFRDQLQILTEKLNRDFLYRMAKKYGIITERKEPVMFYFERLED